MLLYRIENKNGIGVYRCAETECKCFFNAKRHVGPLRDEKLMATLGEFRINHESCVYGFESILQLKKWFYTNEILIELNNKGLICNIYDVPVIYHGDAQAVMLKGFQNKQYIVGAHSLLEFLN